MENDFQKLRQREREEGEHKAQGTQGLEAAEFASAEEALRADRATVEPPEELAEKVAAAVRQEPKSGLSWWARWFSRG